MSFVESKWEYATVLILCVSLPFLFFCFHPRIKLRQQWLFLVISIILPAIPFLIWDYFATVNSHWQFNSDFILGLYIFNLPLEEVLFFVAIPFCCHFIWYIIDTFQSWPQFWHDFWLK